MTNQRKIKVLITSVGSLVGQNILDVLEFEGFSRRNLVTIYGTNSVASSPNNFRCDECFLLPNTSSDDFEMQIVPIIRSIEPDIILSGRDEDTEVLWQIVNNYDLNAKVPYGELQPILYALDKWQTWEFSEKHGVPYAATFMMGKSGGIEELKSFCDKYEFPLIAKPVRGFASKGVFFIRNWEEALEASEFENYIFQEYLGEKGANDKYFKMMDGFTPLFAHAPNIYHHSCHTFVSPSGEIDSVFISRNEHDSGVTMGFQKVYDDELERLTLNYAKALFAEKGAGPVTVQFRKDKHGKYKAQEMNMRTNGNTFPRFLLGQDDLGLIINSFLPEFEFPIYKVSKEAENCVINKSLSSNKIENDQLELLITTKSWKKKI